MAPQLREHSNNILEHLNPVLNFPATENDFLTLSDMEIWSSSELESEDENNVADWNVPVQNDLMDLLIKVTATENLLTVTQVQLKVITREISLQQLSIYTPALRELILDGSEVSSLRDLGCELKNLKVLRLNRCNLHYLDSVSGIDQLEELYAADNHLTDISSCAFLPSIKVIDVRRNFISTTRCLFFLSVCSELQHLYLEGNEVAETKNFAGEIREQIPTLKFLDGHPLQGKEKEALHAGSVGIEALPEKIENRAPSRNHRDRETRRFIIQFPPKLLIDSLGKSPRTM
ncbi:leucine-rich repeat-containing protein 56 [Coccinella septempunctata]|uniref:leucine-rich repeat-containing protein 56 n=1 Tax=Coccinella septempunctata TaxID=41139 RepID=UPI001D099954|nr:leucine-rich repeat-containing protein 56 [Coccinella septempunctata]